MKTKADAARVTGKGVVTGWLPGDLARKFKLEAALRAAGWENGAAMEEKVLFMLAQEGVQPQHRAESENSLVTVGQALWCDLLIGAGGTDYRNANAALGVGDSNTAFALGQTNLQGAVNVTDRIRKAMDATYPSRSGNVVTFRATFATTDANFQWNEWAIFNNVTDAAGTMLNRAVSNLGTKTSALAWQLTVTMTLS